MGKKRSRLEIIRDLLEILRSNRKTKITHLIYKANLSSNVIKGYLKELFEKGLATEVAEGKKKFFVITKKGMGFLQEFDKMIGFVEAYGLEY